MKCKHNIKSLIAVKFLLLFFMKQVFYILIFISTLLQACNPTPPTPVGPPDGMAIFRKNCVACHGPDGKLGLTGAKDLSASVLPVADRIQIITNGKNVMTPFKALLSEAEIRAVAEYSRTLNPQNTK